MGCGNKAQWASPGRAGDIGTADLFRTFLRPALGNTIGTALPY